MAAQRELLTPAEASAVSGIPVRAVYKLLRERLPRGAVVRKSGKVFLTRAGAVCARLDRELPKDVPVKIRRALYRRLKLNPEKRIEYAAGPLRYVLETARASKAVAEELAAYRRALEIISVRPDLQGGAATFKGTRILVHHIADLLAQGASATELKADYPNLTHAMLTAAPIYRRAHPKRGRPKVPTWRKAAPSSERRVRRSRA